MTNAARYFKLARSKEVAGKECTSLLLYLSSFCDSFNFGTKDYPCGAIAKIRSLQNQNSLSDQQFLDLVHSYDPLSDAECWKLLSYSICDNTAGIRAILSDCTRG